MPVELKKNDQEDSEGLGRSKGGLTSKIHCVTDGLGNPIDFILTGGEVHDSQGADCLLEDKRSDFVLADKAYDSDAILVKIQDMGAIPVIPPRSHRKNQRVYDRHYYKDRNLIERFFCRLKQFRGIATRYCKRAQYFLGAVKLASSIILMA